MSQVCAGDAVQGLASRVDELVAVHLGARDGVTLGEDLVGIRRQIDRLEAEFARRLSEFDRKRGYVADGASSVVAWLRARCGLAAGGAAGRVGIARELSALPEADRLFREGEIGLDNAIVLARTVSEVGAGAAKSVAAELVDAAQTHDPDRLRQESRSLRFRVDPEGAEKAFSRIRERRFLNVNQVLDGAFLIDGVLDPEGGATLRTAIDALCKPVTGDSRTGGQRRADAIVELATRQLLGGALPTCAGQRPHMLVTVPHTALRGDSEAGSGEIAGAGPIPNAVAQRLACDSVLTAVRIGASGEPLDVGRARRTATPAIRRALMARDRGCVFPGCDRPPEWTDAHHLQPHARNGDTSVANMVLLCRVHHHLRA